MMHPISIGVLIVCIIAILSLKRHRVLLPIILVTCLIPSAQRISILSLDFNMIRILVVFGLLRIMLRKEYSFVTLQIQDKYLIAYILAKTIIHTLQTGSVSTFIFEVGSGFELFGIYYIVRCVVHDWEDIRYLSNVFLLLSIPVAFAFYIEHSTTRNVFSMFGGVPEYSIVRDGNLRCAGPYPHPIIAGVFWATILPFIAARIWFEPIKIYIVLAAIAAITWIIYTTSSSTPLMSMAAAMMGGSFIILRNHMKLIRWSVALMIISLHIVMKAPVWHLISRVSPVPGSTSHFRFMLIDGAIRHLGEWWLLGTTTTAHWFFGAQDITNQYILEGTQGGLLTLILFIVVISLSFRSVGNIWRRTSSKSHLAMSWALGVILFVHCVSFIGVSYFGQITVLWSLILAVIASLDQSTKEQLSQQNKGDSLA